MIIALATILFVSMVSTQIFWVKNAYDITQHQTQHEIELALLDVVKDIQLHRGDSTFLIDPVQMIEPNFYRVLINEELQPYYLEALLKTALLNRELNYEFRYSIYDCFNDSVVFSKNIANKHDQGASKEDELPPPTAWNHDGHYFSVHFPTLDFEILSRMKFWVLSSMVMLALLVFFSFVISVILKQKRLSEIKNDFINNMTHELKTPISTIALSSDVLLQKDIVQNPERLRSYASIIKSENQRLQSQVERVLQVARLDKEEVGLVKSLLDIHELIELAVPTIKMNFSNPEPIINTKLNAERHLVYGDEMHLTNVVFNLLDNAAKYAIERPVIQITTQSNNKGLTLIVKDSGPGIAKEHQKHIFDKFYRVPTGNVHDVKGFGLGLHYVKTIVEAHGGKVRLKSRIGEGSAFEVFLPFGKEFVK